MSAHSEDFSKCLNSVDGRHNFTNHAGKNPEGKCIYCGTEPGETLANDVVTS